MRYVMLDTDGNCEALIPQFLECGVDAIWPLERAVGMDPLKLRAKFGKELRLFVGVDKMELAKDELFDAVLARAEIEKVRETYGKLGYADYLRYKEFDGVHE